MMTSPPSPRQRVAVTAAGLVTPLGLGLEENREALGCARPGISPVRLFETEGCRCRMAGQVDEGRLDEISSATRRRAHRSGKMMEAAARELLAADPGFRPELSVVGTTSGGMSFGEAFFRSLAQGQRLRAAPGELAHYGPQKAVIDLHTSLGFGGIPCQVIANACASGANAIGHAYHLIAHGLRRRVLAGGYDALSELVYVGFDSLQASTPDLCRPFDRDRSGLVMGEGAALVSLEAWDDAIARGAPILAEVIGYGLSTDNHHLTQPHPSGIGPRMAMERALADAGLSPSAIDYINAHGTATPFNDATEGAAIEAIFGPGRVPVSSTKGQTGHTLGAAGAIEAVFCLLALRTQHLPANLNYVTPDPQWHLDLVANTPRPAKVKTVLTNSFGFGGTNATLILRQAEGRAAS